MSTGNEMKTGGRWPHLLLWALLATVVALPVMISGTPRAVEARRYGYKPYNYQAIIARCQGRCANNKGAIFACIGHDQKLAMKNCRADFKTCRADPSCKADAKSRLHLCMQSARGPASDERKAAGAGPCNSCCRRSRGQGDCLSYFSGSRRYGSYRYRGRLTCAQQDEGGGGDGTCAGNCDAVAKRALARCAPISKKDPNCQADVEAQRQACLAACSPASPSGAFLPGMADAIRAQLARFAPWLVDGRRD